ncbi:hypothetical protein [Bifidobacterium animalis]|uniref:Uncharacterized protein n=1 Tax=Bifidobacterium animalis subsp. lactis TaxID=302911 RepID=A0A8B3RG97_BIFAN|nr:hypothetical protein [Bifidobacterium animalis]RYM91886.1 hypothetical protein PG2011B_1680 [Bifidobacterium animalis subsp. lactis]
MRNTNHKTIITTTIITLLAIVATILIMVHNKPASQTQAQPAATSTHTTSPTPTPTLNPQQLADTAIRFEQQARNWGTDPNLNLDQVKTMDQAVFLGQTRMPDPTMPDMSRLTVLHPADGQGRTGRHPPAGRMRPARSATRTRPQAHGGASRHGRPAPDGWTGHMSPSTGIRHKSPDRCAACSSNQGTVSTARTIGRSPPHGRPIP